MRGLCQLGLVGWLSAGALAGVSCEGPRNCPDGPIRPKDGVYHGTSAVPEGEGGDLSMYADVTVVVSGDTATVTWPMADGTTRQVVYRIGEVSTW